MKTRNENGTGNRETIKNHAGTISLLTTITSSIWLSIAGENLLIWIIFLVSSITGIIHNYLLKNKKMTLVFTIFLVTNSIAIIRLII